MSEQSKTSIALLNDILGTADQLEKRIVEQKKKIREMLDELLERDERFMKLIALYMALNFASEDTV